MQSIISVGGDLWINNNEQLTDISSFSNLLSIGQYLYIIENESINNLEGLGNISSNSIQRLYLYNNPLLSDCAVKSICDFLAAPNGTIEIHDNAPGCSSQQEVMDACDSIQSPVFEFAFESEFTLIPNPVERSTIIKYSLQQPSIITLKIHDISGREVANIFEGWQRQGIQQVVFDGSQLNPGIYFCILKVNLSTMGQTKKLIKL